MPPPPFEELEHTADWSLLVKGETLESLFTNASEGMLSLLEPEYLDPDPARRLVTLNAIDIESLLVSFLDELLFLLETESCAMRDITLNIEGNALRASAKCVPVGAMSKHIKAVTYNELEITREQGFYQTKLVFDV